MTAFNEKNGVPLGEGLLSPDGSVQDKDLSGNLRSYKARVAGSYRAALPEEITSEIKAGKYWVSPKVDGELWFLILGDGSPWLASPKGKVISGKIPLLEEAAATASKAEGRTVVAGELFAAVKSGRPPLTCLVPQSSSVQKEPQGKLFLLLAFAQGPAEDEFQLYVWYHRSTYSSIPFVSSRAIPQLLNQRCCSALLFGSASDYF